MSLSLISETSHLILIFLNILYLYDNLQSMQMKTELKRRDFISKCLKAGATGCVVLYSNSLFAQNPLKLKKEDLKSLTYCCYKCTPECPTYKATVENSTEQKKKVYENAKWKEKYGIEFDPDKVVCYGCKVTDKPLSINVKACAVRTCAIEKGYDCCIECNGLTACDKKLWKSYPDFKEKVIGFQKSYLKS